MNKQEALYKYFGYREFRSGQEQLIDGAMNGRDVLGVMPTGSGKSICYQLPAIMSGGIALVISPLISLMKDQVDQLREAGVDAAFLNSSLTTRQQSLALERAAAGQYKIMYIAPERLDSFAFTAFARSADISLVAVDEAHCVSHWGQDFRPSYLKIPEFIALLSSVGKRPTVCAYTATATGRVREDIIRLLGLIDPLTVVTGFDRPNLFFEVRRPQSKPKELLSILSSCKGRSGIVYCSTQRTVEEVCDSLNAKGYSATRYHAGLDAEERRCNQEDFLYDRKSVMVATCAFGMGIDKSNVSFVIHYNMPKDIESYYQEAGRAGRDGEPASCILLYSGQDIITNKFLINRSYEEQREDQDGLTRQQLEDKHRLDLKRLQVMISYCETSDCLRGWILNYFGERAPDSCDSCGTCIGRKNGTLSVESIDITMDAQKIISLLIRLQRMGRAFGKGVITECLRGEINDKTMRFHLDRLKTFGAMSDSSEEHIRDVIDYMIIRDYIEVERREEFQVLTPGERAAELLAPDAHLGMTVRKQRKAKVTKLRDADIEVDSELMSRLSELRKELARRASLPPFAVMSDATLRDMCRKLPRTADDMSGVSGIGEVKKRRYGEQFAEVINSYLTEKASTAAENAAEGAVPEQESSESQPTEPVQSIPELIASRKGERKKRKEKLPFHLDEQLIAKVYVSEESVSIGELTRYINEQIDRDEMKCVTGITINIALAMMGYIDTVEHDGRSMKIATEKGMALGITTVERDDIEGFRVYLQNLFNPAAQRWIIEHINELCDAANEQPKSE